METVEYATGRLADLFGEQGAPTVLMWHGAQSDARFTMRPLAERVAGHGYAVVLPDWDSHADDRGRADLLCSLDFAHGQNRVGLILVGWSLGGVAAAGVAIDAQRRGVRVARTVCLAGAFMVRDPVSGEHLPTDLTGYDSSPFTLLHGAADGVVPTSAGRDFAAMLRRHSWPVEVAELDADHGAIAGAGYDPQADRYFAATDPQTLAVAADVAARIAAAAS